MSLGNAIKYNRENGKLEWSEGYRYEDLNDENKNIIDWLNHLVEGLDGLKGDYELESEDTTILEKIRNEIAIQTIIEAKEWLDASIDEIQVSLIENQGDEE